GEAAPAEAKAAEAAADEAADEAVAKAASFDAVVPENLPPPVPEASPDAVRLTMADALRVAVRASRDYQDAKETVYQAALALTLQRYMFRPHPFTTGSVNFDSTDADGRQRSWDPSADVGITQQLADGAIVAGSMGITALKYLNRQLGDTVDTALDFSLTQPLWRGAGRKIVQENLFQAERNAVYAVRTFAKFEQDFAVSIASDYLHVLQARDVVMNQWQNYLSLKAGRERSEWLAKAERQAEFQVDQARQDELSAYNRWVIEREGYVNSLDAFKITLGIPVTTEVALDHGEMARLVAQGLRLWDIAVDDAIGKSLITRLDLANTREGLEDAERKVLVAEDDLKGDVDLVASIGYASRADRPQSARIAFRRGDYSVGFDIDMPVDRLQERNALRQTQIDLAGAARGLENSRDNVILAVRRAFRRLDQARESYQIQQRSLALAERRVESTQLLLQAGRVNQRDVLEAERALLTARNSLTSALVAHTIAGLEFERDVGTLVVDEEGQIHGWNLTDEGR
ncbi:MAG: TolC family protein, partial [Planctomycetes bacterium]|nr:TolC family protein [Planctomycetota bacterium]